MLEDVQLLLRLTEHHAIKIQCVLKVAVHLGYGRVQLNCDGTH